MEGILNQVYYGNTILAYLIAAGIFIIGIIVVKVFTKIVVYRLKKISQKTETTLDDFIIRGIEKTVVPLLYFGAFYLAIQSLKIDPRVREVINVIAVIILTFLTIRLIISIIRYSLNSYIAKKGGDDTELRQKQMRGILTIISIIVWGFGLVFLLDNMGFDIAAVITGLGIGGIAIALAAQTILGDLFSYFVIFFDRPFEIGDFIIVNDKMGSVEYIGLKTTRLRSLGGEQLVFSNTDLVNSRLHNYKKMERRRVVFKIGVTYQTKAEQLEEIPKIIKKIIEDTPDATFDRAHFFFYGDFSLIYEIVYYVLSADYNKYGDIQQAINFAIYREFEKREIVFAYPTQTLFLNKENWDSNENLTSEIEK